MTRPTHQELVEALVKPGNEVLKSLTGHHAHIWHMATGAATEAGELLDAAKKFVIYEKPLDRKNVVEELGDLEFYMEGIRNSLGITREETLEGNITKLLVRYEGMVYSNDAAQSRNDKA